MSQRISYTVTGKVQGVFFRKETIKQANRLGVTGNVRNASDGSVQGEAQGSQDAIKDFVQYLHKGPSAAEVSDVTTKEIDAKCGETGFGQH